MLPIPERFADLVYSALGNVGIPMIGGATLEGFARPIDEARVEITAWPVCYT